VIVNRSKQQRSFRSKLLRHPWRWGSAAAAVILIATTLSMYIRRDQSPVASATYIPVGAHLTLRGTEKRFDVPIRAGELVEGGEGYTVLDFRNGNRLAMQPQTKLTVLKGGQDIDLQTGCMYIQAATGARVQAGVATISLDEPNAKTIIDLSPAGGKCLVQSGRVKLVVAGRETVLAAGQMGSWDSSGGDLHILPLDSKDTGWVREALEGATKDA
jgi:hypothetical protein